MNSAEHIQSPLVFARLEAQEAAALAALEQRCFTLPWSEEQYRAVFQHTAFYAYGLRDATHGLVAYMTFYATADTLEILNIATHPDQRRKGYARMLLTKVMELARRMDITEAALEVRQHNIAAMALYESLGFHRAGLRKGYYPDTGEDAIIYTAIFVA